MSRSPWTTARIPERVAKRIRFTPELWDKWFAARRPDAHTAILREGIRQMRARIDMMESMLTPRPDPDRLINLPEDTP